MLAVAVALCRSLVPSLSLKCDTVIPAIGQAVDTKVLDEKSGVKWTKWKTVQTNPHNYMTDRKGVFAGGDCSDGCEDDH